MKKLIAMLLALTMISVMFVACSQETATTETTEATEATQPIDTEATVPGDVEVEVDPSEDLGETELSGLEATAMAITQ